MNAADTPSPPPPRWDLLRNFARLLLFAVALPVAVLAGIVVWRGAVQAREEYDRRLAAAAELSIRDIDSFLHTHLSALQVLAELRSQPGQEGDAETWAVDLARVHRHYPDFNSLAVADAQGRVRLVEPAIPGAPGQIVAARSYFSEPQRTGRAHVSDAYRGRGGDRELPSVAMSAPLTVQGRFAGIVGGAIRIDAFPTMQEQARQARGFGMLLLDRRNTVIYATSELPYAPLDAIDPTSGVGALQAQTASSPMQFLPGVLRDGEDAFGKKVALKNGWQLVVMVPESTVVADLRRSTAVMLGLLAMVVLGVLGIAGAQMRGLGANVRDLLQSMQRFALDSTEGPVDVPGDLPQELAPLAQALTQLSTRAREAYGVVTLSLEEQQRLRAELQAATRALLTAQEDERNAISRELHDDIGQQITAIKLGATLLGEGGDPAERTQILGEIITTADETVAKLRNLSLLLRPPQLDSVGLEAALRWHAERVFRSGRTRVELALATLPCRPDPEVALAGFRIAQEAMTNVLRHADASRVTVTLEPCSDDEHLRLVVTDDGRGIAPGQAPGLGLVTMRERAQQLGGTLHIQGEPGRGTVVEAILPFRCPN